MKLWSYLCPECDTHTKTVYGRPRPGGISVECPECGNLEFIPDPDRNKRDRVTVQ